MTTTVFLAPSFEAVSLSNCPEQIQRAGVTLVCAEGGGGGGGGGGGECGE